MGVLEEALGRLRRTSGPDTRPGPSGKRLDLGPNSTFEALLEQRIQALEGALGELKARINGLIFLLIGVVIIQVVAGFMR